MTKPNPEDQAWATLGLLRTLQLVRRESLHPQLGAGCVSGEGPVVGAEAFVIMGYPNAQATARRNVYDPVLRQLMLAALLSSEDWQDEDRRIYGVANAWMTYAVPFRTPGNRWPEPAEIKSFRSILRQEWLAVGKPRLIVPVGRTAMKAIGGTLLTYHTLVSSPGQLHHALDKEGESIYVWPMLTPDIGVRNDHLRQYIEDSWYRLGDWRLKHAEETRHPRG